MRLIDADELLESFRKCYKCHMGMGNSDSMMMFRSICRIINEQQTVEAINGKEYVSKYVSCPMCVDCPDGCPLEKKRISIPPKGGNVAQKN